MEYDARHYLFEARNNNTNRRFSSTPQQELWWSYYEMVAEIKEFKVDKNMKLVKNQKLLVRMEKYKEVTKKLAKEMEEQESKNNKSIQGILSFWDTNCGREYELRRDCQQGRNAA